MTWRFLIGLLLLSCMAGAADYGKTTMTKVAEDIYLFTTSPYGDVGMSGNSVAILTKEGVVVFDTSATPQTASLILAEIRKLTPQPVKYVVNSHWHWDHWGGNQSFKAAYPDAQIITHEKTREQMMQVEPRWNDEGLKTQLPAYIDSLQKKLRELQQQNASAKEISDLQALVKADGDFYQQKISLEKTYPDKTFSQSLTLRPGGREINILHARAITIGDTYLFLPKERILITGDIMLNPVPFAIGGTYPGDWLKTLRSFASLKPALIIPGHGEPRADPRFLQGYISLLQDGITLVKKAKAKGMNLEQTKRYVGEQAKRLAADIGVGDEKVPEFKGYFLDVFIARAFEEQEHPLGDLPGGLSAQ